MYYKAGDEFPDKFNPLSHNLLNKKLMKEGACYWREMFTKVMPPWRPVRKSVDPWS